MSEEGWEQPVLSENKKQQVQLLLKEIRAILPGNPADLALTRNQHFDEDDGYLDLTGSDAAIQNLGLELLESTVTPKSASGFDEMFLEYSEFRVLNVGSAEMSPADDTPMGKSDWLFCGGCLLVMAMLAFTFVVGLKTIIQSVF